MKPIKNNIYCHGCNHTKILFKSKEEAVRFIRFNADEIERESGNRPVRAYFCEFCGGWHVTSRPYTLALKKFIARFGDEEGERLHQIIQSVVKRGKSIERTVMLKIKTLKRMLRFLVVDLERCRIVIKEIIEILEALFKTRIINLKCYNMLFEAFMVQVEIFKQKYQLN